MPDELNDLNYCPTIHDLIYRKKKKQKNKNTQTNKPKKKKKNTSQELRLVSMVETWWQKVSGN